MCVAAESCVVLNTVYSSLCQLTSFVYNFHVDAEISQTALSRMYTQKDTVHSWQNTRVLICSDKENLLLIMIDMRL